MKKTIILNFKIIFILALFSVGCGTSNKNEDQVKNTIPYKIVNKYFALKDTLSNPKIIDKQTFENSFGAAVIMGENGNPTSIDFNKEYVIAFI